MTDAACPTDIEFYRHFQLNGSWTEDGVDGRLHVKKIQSSNDLPPPQNDQVKRTTVKLISKKSRSFIWLTLAWITLFITCYNHITSIWFETIQKLWNWKSNLGGAVDQPEFKWHGLLQLHCPQPVWWCRSHWMGWGWLAKRSSNRSEIINQTTNKEREGGKPKSQQSQYTEDDFRW